MKVTKQYNEDHTALISRVIYSSVEEFEKSLEVALWAAEQPNTVVEVWKGDGCFTLTYNAEPSAKKETATTLKIKIVKIPERIVELEHQLNQLEEVSNE